MNQNQFFKSLKKSAEVEALKELIQEFREKKDNECVKLLEEKLKKILKNGG